MSCVRRLALTLALVLAAGLRAATAQTVIVRNAPAGATVDLTWNNGSPVSAKADQAGDATLTVPSQGDHSVQVYVDVCGSNRVVVVLIAFGQAVDQPDAGCSRKSQWGVYMMRPITTFVVEMNNTESNVYVSQGPPPKEWVLRGDALRKGRINWDEPRTGLTLGAAIGTGSFTHVRDSACGNITHCDQTSINGALVLNADYWIKPWLAAYGSFFLPINVDYEGNDTNFEFDSHLQARVTSFGGKIGGRAKAARIYGIAGINYHEATFTHNQTVHDQTITVDGVAQVLPGGTFASGDKTTGWNWTFGGGVEAWTSKWLAFYGEFHRVKITGKPEFEIEGGIDSQMTTVTVGLRVRLGR